MSAAQTVRGTVTDRPWGLTLGAIGVGGRTGTLTLRADDKSYKIVFEGGTVVEATSPLAADSAARVALANHLVTPGQVNEIKRRIIAAPTLDDVDVLAATVRLDPESTKALRQRIVLQRAARTFSVDHGDYVFEEGPVPKSDLKVDIRAVVFAGARMNLSEQRLLIDLRQFGTRFQLKPGIFEDFDRFGFSATERPIVDALRVCSNLAELEANHREIDPRAAQAVVYALASCDELAQLAPEPGELPPRVTRPTAVMRAMDPASLRESQRMRAIVTDPPPQHKAAAVGSGLLPRLTRDIPILPRAQAPLPSHLDEPTTAEIAFDELAEPTFEQGMGTGNVPFEEPPTNIHPNRQLDHVLSEIEESTGADPILDETNPTPGLPFSLEEVLDATTERSAGVPEPARDTPSQQSSSVPRSMLESFRTGRVTAVRPNALTAHEVVKLIKERAAMLERGVDHFTLLGLSIGAPIEDVHAAYVELSRHLRPQRLAELNIRDDNHIAQRLLAQIGIAFTILTDRVRRPEYIATLNERSHH